MTAHVLLVRAMLAVFVVVAAAGVAVGAVGVGACGGGSQDESWDVELFKPHFEEYMALAEAPQAKNANPSYSGKVIIMDTVERWTDYNYIERLIEQQSPVLAYSPEEVGAVVFVSYKDMQVGSHVGGGKAYTRRATLTVVDAKTKKAIARKTWNGGPPPSEVQWGFDGYGPVPVKKMLAWVEGMAGGQ